MEATKNVPAIRFKSFNDEWKEKKLGEVMTVTSVKRILQSDWTDNGIRFLRARDIVAAYKNEKVSESLYISKERYDEYSLISGKVQEGDLLVTGVGSIGIPMLILNEQPLYFKDGNIIWFKNEKKISPHFFYYSFLNRGIQNFICNSAGIGTVGTYTIESGKKTPIQLPEPTEQVQIGNYFKELDGLIKLHEQRLEKVTNLKNAMLEKMFPKEGADLPEIRFKGFTKKWKKTKLEDIIDLNSGKDYKHLSPGNIPVYGTGGYMRSVNSALSYKENAIGIGRKGTIDKPFILHAPFWTVDTLFYAVAKPKNDLDFIYSIFQRINWKEKDESTGVPSLSKNSINNVYISVVASPSEQALIGNYFYKLDQYVSELQQKIKKLNHLKQALLKKMFI